MRSPCTTTKSSPRSLPLEEARAQQRRPNSAKEKKRKKEKKRIPKQEGPLPAGYVLVSQTALLGQKQVYSK